MYSPSLSVALYNIGIFYRSDVKIRSTIHFLWTMDRKEFLEKLGLGAAFVLTTSCLGGCTRDEAPESRDIDFTIDLRDEKYIPLRTPGGYIIEEDVVVARSITGEYIAATVLCSHEPNKNITYRQNDGVWFCTVHGAEYNEEGTGLNALGSKGLTIYNTDLDGNNLRVFT